MNKTAISWTDYTSNIIKFHDPTGKQVWGCVKVSDGCKNCYAESLAHRYQGGEFTVKRMATLTPFFDEKEAAALLSPKRLPAGSKVFIGDMTDVFGEWVPDEMLDRMFAVFALRPDVVFQVLTKRPERMRRYLGDPNRHECVEDAAFVMAGGACEVWPLPNCWLGTSVEDQAAANARIPELLGCPAAVRFLSCEPLLGPVDVRRWLDECGGLLSNLAIEWVIVGGESGPGARPMDVAWARSLVSQCRDAGVAVFVKQLGARPCIMPDLKGVAFGEWTLRDRPDGTHWERDHNFSRLGLPIRLKDRKGEDMSEWSADLRMREFPGVSS